MEGQPGSAFYKSDGRLSLLPFVLLLLFGIVVSVVMAVVLLIVQDYWYYFIITPIVLSLPVWAMVYAIVHVGKCRNVVAAGVAGVLLFWIFYFGFWTLDYGVFRLSCDEEGLAALEQMGGSTSLIGYFHFRCKTTSVEDVGSSLKDEKPDPFGAYMFFGVESLIFLFAPIFSIVMSQRVYYPDLRRWAASKAVCMPKTVAEAAFSALVAEDWDAFSQLPRLPANAQNVKKNPIQFKVEYAKDTPNASVYLTLTGVNAKAMVDAMYPEQQKEKRFIPDEALLRTEQLASDGDAQHKLCLAIRQRGSVKQYRISPASATRLAERLPELKLPQTPAST